jgi:DNA-binding transcriptional ArsR family regulator
MSKCLDIKTVRLVALDSNRGFDGSQAGQDGVRAGQVAELLKLAPDNLTFHFDRLRHAGLISVRRDGRSMIYTARYEAMNGLLAYLTDNCCAGVSGECGTAPSKSRRCARQHSS